MCALDTELLGHWWFEGVAWLGAVLAEADRQGLALATAEDALARHEPRAVEELPDCTWGIPRDLSTWSGPPAAELAWQARRAELRLLRERPARGRAARELLALQSSDWAFLTTREAAGPYPRERARGARIRPGGGTRLPRRLRAGAQPRARSLASPRFWSNGSSGASRPRPLLGVPAADRGRARAPRAQALRAARRPGRRRPCADPRRRGSPTEEEVDGVLVHRVHEPRKPTELGEFVTWIEHMNADMLAAGVELGDRLSFDLVHGHDWLVAHAGGRSRSASAARG